MTREQIKLMLANPTSNAFAGNWIASEVNHTRSFHVRDYFWLAILLGLRLASESTASVAFLGLGVYALFGLGCAVRSLACCWLFIMINPGIAPEASFASTARYFVIFGAATSALLHGCRARVSIEGRRLMLFTFLLGAMVVIHSLLFSKVIDVSALKAASWSITTLTLLCLWMSMTDHDRNKVAIEVFSGLVGLTLISVPLLASTTGYLRNGWGFQGALNHPQAFGPVAAVLAVWSSMEVLAQRRPRWVKIGFIGLCIALVLASRTRTAGVAMVAGAGAATAIAPWMTRLPMRMQFRGLQSPRVWILFLTVVLAVVTFAQNIVESVETFIQKGGSAASLFDAYEESRGRLIGRMVENIISNPLTGIGFGIASEYSDIEVDRSGFLGLPTAAPVEKGVVFFAIVEELGLPTGAIMFIWILQVSKASAQAGLVSLAICLTVLFLNFGDATFFSPGGAGMLWIILITLAASQQLGTNPNE